MLQTESKNPVLLQPVAEARVAAATADAQEKTLAEQPAVTVETSLNVEASVDQADVPSAEVQTSDAGDKAVIDEKQQQPNRRPSLPSHPRQPLQQSNGGAREADAKLDQARRLRSRQKTLPQKMHHHLPATNLLERTTLPRLRNRQMRQLGLRRRCEGTNQHPLPFRAKRPKSPLPPRLFRKR